MWHRLGISTYKPLVRFLGTVAITGYAAGFVASPSTLNLSEQSSWPVRVVHDFYSRFHLNQKTTLCEGVQDRSEIDGYQLMKTPERGQSDNHVIFGLLLGANRIEKYDVYKRQEESTNKNVIIAYVKLGNKIDGHPGVVHGGILSLIFDDAFGFGYEALGVKKAVTANLNVDFRAPVSAGTHVRVAAQVERIEGRKIYWKAQMTSLDEETLYAEATSLYIIPRPAS